ncbi:MAG: EboA domain-containing protein [Pseudomonadota bacterium]
MTAPAELLKTWICRQAGSEAEWVEGQLDALAETDSERDLHIYLGFAPRRLGKADLDLTSEDLAQAGWARPGWDPAGWSIDGAARVLGLLTFKGPRPFAEVFKDLRRTADAAEMVALYRGLPLYPDPASLEFEVGEALRSNLKPVFEAVAHANPYPRDHFDEHRWNHMVLKALFIGSELTPITGSEDRANPDLARILAETAQERWAAGRTIDPEIWRLIRPHAAHPEVGPILARARAEGRDIPENVS